MKLEELLYQKLTGDSILSPLLAVYSGVPAVFEFLAPDDSAPGWNGVQSPRIEYEVSRVEDPERKVSGEITLSIIHRDKSNATAAQIEVEVHRILDGTTFATDDGTITLLWKSIDLFEQDDEYRGMDLVFDLIAWPTGLTYAPDPVQALRDWAAAKWAGLQVDPSTWSPSDNTPALYWRMASIDSVDMMSWGAWITARFQGHVLANTPGVRVEWLRKVVEGAALERQVQLSDGSDLFFQSIGADSEADPLRNGQIRISARFGVLAPSSTEPTINIANVSGAATGSVT